jgi:hypothetical protein
MLDAILLVSWRASYARNEVTHNKPLSSVEGSRRFLCGYLQLIRNTKIMPTGAVIKGKIPLLQSTAQRQATAKIKPPDKPWCKPPPGYVKL